MTQFAVIKTGGKQYVVRPGQTVRIEKVDIKEGDSLHFDALLVADDSSVTVGTPIVSGTKVNAKVVRHARDKKKIIFRYHAKTRYRKKKGHRQHFTEIKIEDVKK
ncbi:MAG: 50S ribosomal protein L21 [Candidatus Sungbacteria bacterium RIFCSPLOWO2_01_FULL_47_10]|uniref:Large ribosomal subunit protein bL21 n=1 Tax=Candidatus Sungbacteria bacterium RIFCSPLOWO2_01_FULL_47_10 TaxID=1802276 RepID=A0A1G2L229_9BACT|nr:MAG: 50S ribosomal protein L21 [Candidatus Sungbacteria bacterium RIFCSPLOWO2_01_FULL_47_10]